MKQPLEAGLPMTTPTKTKPTPNKRQSGETIYCQPSISFQNWFPKPKAVLDPEVEIFISETKVVAMKVRPRKGIFKSRVSSGK